MMENSPFTAITSATVLAMLLLVGCASSMQTVGEKPAEPSSQSSSSLTTKEIESYWDSVAKNATRVVTTPRIAQADSRKGEGMLEAFGTQYMPNAYDIYEKVRATAKEREQILKENFPQGSETAASDATIYKKVFAATAKAVSVYFRRRDELCHFYLMHKAGIITGAELSELDSSPICVMLPGGGGANVMWKQPNEPKPTELAFAQKYRPETFAAYERLKTLFDAGVKDYGELLNDIQDLDAVRGGGVLAPLAARLSELSKRLDAIAKTLRSEKLCYDVGELTAWQLADSDSKFRAEIRAFEKTLPVRDYAKAWLANNTSTKEMISLESQEIKSDAGFNVPLQLTLQHTMVPIPGKNYAICKFEVTQALWKKVMGSNPSSYSHTGDSLPVENVSWNDCQKFLAKLNAMPEFKEPGFVYRLPTADEWEFACRAGAIGDFCRLEDGTEITRHTLDKVAWFDDNSGGGIHPVGQKKPNAFGLYDMHGNVAEWTSTTTEARSLFGGKSQHPIICGGCYFHFAFVCAASRRVSESPNRDRPLLGGSYGLRLAAEKSGQ